VFHLTFSWPFVQENIFEAIWIFWLPVFFTVPICGPLQASSNRSIFVLPFCVVCRAGRHMHGQFNYHRRFKASGTPCTNFVCAVTVHVSMCEYNLRWATSSAQTLLHWINLFMHSIHEPAGLVNHKQWREDMLQCPSMHSFVPAFMLLRLSPAQGTNNMEA
jgi:hypothetical protein